MADPRFYEKSSPVLSAASLAEKIGAKLAGDGGAAEISDVADLSRAKLGDIVFWDGSQKYADDLATCKASAIIVKDKDKDQIPKTIAVLTAENPHQTHISAMVYFYPTLAAMRPVAGVQKQAIDPSAKIEKGVAIGVGAVIGANVEIGADTHIGANAVIGHGCVIGRNCVIGAQSVVSYAIIGDGVHIYANASIGQDGFGFIPAQPPVKIPHLGRVVVQNDVEIGANSTIDRGTLLDTSIGEGTKIDNFVHVAHNVEIGQNCLIAGKVGFAGSGKIGNNVIIGGQVGVAGHLEIGDGVTLQGGTVVTKSVPANSTLAGFPAKDIEQWRKEIAALSRLAKAKPKAKSNKS